MKDHVALGKALDLFVQSPLVGKGLPLFTPRGTAVLMVLKRFIEDEEMRRGYEFTSTPFLAGEELYKVSGHWDLYREHMFLVPRDGGGDEEGRYLSLRPMTCPFQFQIYNRRQHSYRDLPVRYAETSTLFRNEASGALHGLVRIRQFTLSEGHIICRPDQVEAEFRSALDLTRHVMKTIGIEEFWYRFSRHDPADTRKYIDDPEAWAHSEALLRSILDKTGERYVEVAGEAAFYGPKLDIQVRDVLGREETLFTLQLDFALPRRFGMTYIDTDGVERHPMVIHRSSIGCYERTLALLLERYQGRLPFWMAPVQVRVLSVSMSSAGAAVALRDRLAACGIRAEADDGSDTLGKKIHTAHEMAVPVLAVLGDREVRDGTVSIRRLNGGEVTVMSDSAFVSSCADHSSRRAGMWEG